MTFRRIIFQYHNTKFQQDKTKPKKKKKKKKKNQKNQKKKKKKNQNNAIIRSNYILHFSYI